MNSISAPVPHPIPDTSMVRQCCGRVAGVNGPALCRRKVVWSIDGIGDMCNYCWTIYFADHWRDIDLDRVHRLSDREQDFHNKPQAGLPRGAKIKIVRGV